MGHLYGVGSEKKVVRNQAATAALLSVLFMVVYGFCNWAATQRSHVGTLYFDWELQIPLIPWFIIPYMSIDLFFVVAPFLCGEAERKVFARRITLAILVAGCFFLAMPLRLGYVREEVPGFTGPIFAFLYAFDPPMGNLFPSLHITLRTLLAAVYLRHTTGVLRVVLRVWFSLIGFSTVFTHQHHLADILGGFALAAFCFYAFREVPAPVAATTNPRMGWRYGLAAGLFGLFALAAWPWGALLLWPGVSLLIAAAGYFWWGGLIYRKEWGRLPLSTRIVMAPCLLGQYLSLLYYRRRCNDWDEIVPGLLLGRTLEEARARHAIDQGVTAVLDVTSEFSANPAFLRLDYLNIPILDLTAPTREQIEEGVAFIERGLRGGKVYVHCKIGYSRSSAFVAAYLLKQGLARDAGEAVAFIRKQRPSLVVRAEIRAALEAIEQTMIEAELSETPRQEVD